VYLRGRKREREEREKIAQELQATCNVSWQTFGSDKSQAVNITNNFASARILGTISSQSYISFLVKFRIVF